MDQLVEGIVWSSHTSTETCRVDLSLLKRTFETDENSETRLEFEYITFCFSLRWLRYITCLLSKDEKKLSLLGEMLAKYLRSHLQEIFTSDAIDPLMNLYFTRYKSYESSYRSSKQIENMGNLFRWHIEYGLKNEDDGIHPVKYTEVCNSDSKSRGWAECIVIAENQFNLIDEHIKLIKII